MLSIPCLISIPNWVTLLSEIFEGGKFCDFIFFHTFHTYMDLLIIFVFEITITGSRAKTKKATLLQIDMAERKICLMAKASLLNPNFLCYTINFINRFINKDYCRRKLCISDQHLYKNELHLKWYCVFRNSENGLVLKLLSHKSRF